MKILPSIKFAVVAVLVAIIFTVIPHHEADAAAVPTKVEFGGHDILTIPCTCDNAMAHLFVPFYAIGQKLTKYGVLVAKYTFVPDDAQFQLVITDWALGYYDRGNEQCRIGISPYCLTIPNVGKPDTELGTSLPNI